MKPLNALALYRVRLRARWMQECLAAVGIAAGVALLFASQVSSSSLQSSVSQLARGIAGDATLQLIARGPQGMPADALTRVRAIGGVRVAAPVLEAPANAIGPRGSASVQLIGADANLSKLGGELVRHSALRPFAGIGAVVLPAPLARTIGVHAFGQEIHFQLAGRSAELPLYSQLSAGQVGALAASAIAIVPLSSAQEMLGLPGRLSRILIAVRPGAQAQVRAALGRLAAGHLNVEGIDYEERLFAQAASAASQSSTLFSAVSALVGFLFAFNATLLTVPQRRRLIVDLRRDGYTPLTVICVLALDALILGLVACALGLTLGEELSIHVLHANPAFLSLAFAVGSQRVVGWQSVAIAVGGGMLAALVAVLSPLRDVLARDPLAATAPRSRSGAKRSRASLALAGATCAGAATAILLAHPDAAIPGMVLLIAALLVVLPLALGAALTLVGRLARTVISPTAHLATMELGAAGARPVAIAATGALAIFGSVAIAGAHGDLLRGLDENARTASALADVWVSPAGSYDLMTTAPFAPSDLGRLKRLPGVSAVRLYRSGLLDYGDRRTLVIAPAAGVSSLLTGQLARGSARRAATLVQRGGWVVLSQAIASENHLHVGQALVLPTPRPTPMRIAALSTNLGWAPGAIVMSAPTFARAWGSADASAYDVQVAPGFSAARVAGEIRHALGAGSGLSVQSAHERATAQSALSRQSLSRLTQIAALIPIVAVLAMAAAIGAMIWQRRVSLARLKLEGYREAELWRIVLLESALLVGVGCLAGAVFGLYGQQLADRALAHTIDFPIAPSLALPSAATSLALMLATALAILAVPGYLAASVPAAVALAE
jgi:putative ABC transport system permease protein